MSTPGDFVTQPVWPRGDTSPAPIPADYWRETRRPAATFWFVVPWLLIYEWALHSGPTSVTGGVRAGADGWISSAVSAIAQNVLLSTSLNALPLWLPLLCIVSLAAPVVWQRAGWKVRLDTVGGMFAESVLFAFTLVLLGQLCDGLWRLHSPVAALGVMSASDLGPAQTLLRQAAHFAGSGVYEELLFRTVLVGGGMWLLPRLRLPTWLAAALVIPASSLIFSLAHYHDPAASLMTLEAWGDALLRVQSSTELASSFTFRTLAGIVFATLYLQRGLGIAVGTHTLYDVIVGVVLVTRL